ncbi:YfcE family phosphodiesterase [Emticicia sp. CRIBPO]|uniref:metallophosphoesterase family protein n=1 Tax=Emticicia sp. CRIBPO TaxID=2683258 RepID=UPI0014125C47|nr:metallophosphoesterase family protein [Emticicia sp. CRIBPO]NBA88571.1 YfcE family phosphodiesterase [Emticicia sp. CRIBPO]
MTKIGLISDTHSFLDPKVFEHFSECDEIWHIGDIGDPQILKDLQAFKPVKAVFGNIDNQELRWELPEDSFFECEGVRVLLTHIGSLPPTYNPRIRALLKKHEPNLFICGHSHILRVIKDHKYENLVYINPGAAGHHGFHHTRTIMRMTLESKKISNLEVIELGKR